MLQPTRMPALPDDAVAAIGFASASGAVAWVRVWRDGSSGFSTSNEDAKQEDGSK